MGTSPVKTNRVCVCVCRDGLSLIVKGLSASSGQLNAKHYYFCVFLLRLYFCSGPKLQVLLKTLKELKHFYLFTEFKGSSRIRCSRRLIRIICYS